MTDETHRTGGVLRARQGGHARVGYAELFFDLVFVFAVTQLSHRLLGHLTPVGAVETGMLLLAVWWCWVYTAWVTNWLDPENPAVRLLLFALMAAGLLLAIAIPEAFGDRGALFALTFVGIQVGRSAAVAWMMRRADPANMRNFLRIALWSAAAGVFWIWGGFGGDHARMALWAVALLIEYSAPALGFRVPGLGRSTTADWKVEGGHMAERCGLFIIIALGETVLLTGATFAETSWTAATGTGFAAAFVAVVAMWWIYFNIGAERASDHFMHADDPGRIARLAYTYLHLPIVAGIILFAAAVELVLAHPHGHGTAMMAFCILGGAGLYLFGNLLFKLATAGWPPLSHMVGLGLILALVPAVAVMPPVSLLASVTAVLLLVALWETISLRGCRPA